MSERNHEQTTEDLIWSMADTTWRMFVPPIMFVGLGIWADLTWSTKPWLTFLGVVFGFGCSVLLVRRQLRLNK